MCTPVALASFQAVQAWAGIMAQNEAASQVRRFAEQGASDAVRAARESHAALTDSQAEINLSAAQKKYVRMRQGLRERAFLSAALAEGIGSPRALGAAASAESQDVGSLEVNRQFGVAQRQREKSGVTVQAQGRINEFRSEAERHKSVSPLMAALQIGAAGATGYFQGSTLEARYGSPAPTMAMPSGTPGMFPSAVARKWLQIPDVSSQSLI